MIKNYFLLTALATLFTLLTQAQTGTLKGVITDIKTKETLIGVTILANDSAVATTNINGQYEIKLVPKKYVIKFKYVGYEFLNKDAIIKDNETTTLDIIMKETNTQLNEVVVSAGKFEQKLSEITVSMEIIKPELIANKATSNMSQILEQTPGVSMIDGQANIRGGAGYSYGAGSRVAILVDDMPVMAADAGDARWTSLPVENVAQIEVIKGAASALYGSSALNGVINIRTAYPKDKPETKINFMNGIYGRFNEDSANWSGTGRAFNYYGADFHHSQKIGNLDLGFGGQYFMNNDFKQNSDEQRVRFNFNTRYRFEKIKGLSVSLNGNFARKKYANTLLWRNGLTAPTQASDTSTQPSLFTTLTDYIDPSITYFSPKGDKFTLRNRTLLNSNKSSTGQGTQGIIAYNEFQYQKKIARLDLNLIAGVMQSFSKVRSQIYNNHDGSNTALYMQADKKFFDKLNVTLGLRGEYYRIDDTRTEVDVFVPKHLKFTKEDVSYTDSAFVYNNSKNANDTVLTQKTYAGVQRTRFDSVIIARKSKMKPVIRIGLNYEIAKATFIRASFGQGYRFPSIAEKYVSTVGSGLTILPNPKIEAETGWNAEIGLKQGFKVSNWRGFIDASAFWSEYQNMMQFTFSDWADSTQKANGKNVFGFKSINVGQVRITGIDVSVVGKGKIAKDLEVTLLSGFTHINPLNLSFFDFKNYQPNAKQFQEDTTLKNNVLKFRFKNNIKADVQLDYKKVSLGVSFRYNSFMQNIDPLFETKLFSAVSNSFGMKEFRQLHNQGDYVFDLRFSYRINESNKVSFLINNALNRLYSLRPGVVEQPRTFVIQYSLNF
ncbi:MAG: TonB-dependent receptor [Bacteroidia bacterium]|nr:TonB-dependent receptor [Bacteroidia bacterium]